MHRGSRDAVIDALAIGIDLGGTQVRAALADGSGALLARAPR